MSDLIDSFFKEKPWLWPVLARSTAFLLVFLILTVPAYFIFLPFFERVRKEMAAFIGGLAERLKNTQQNRANRLNTEADEFLKDGGLWRLQSEGEGHFVSVVSWTGTCP